jgi:hypothetical protein
MPEQNVASCPQGCCRFVNGQAVSEDEYKAAAQNLAAGIQSREAQITCLKIEDNKTIANAVGFYFGKPVPNAGEPFFPPSFEIGSVTAQNYCVYDVKTNARIGSAQVEQFKKWEDTRKKLIEKKKSGTAK